VRNTHTLKSLVARFTVGLLSLVLLCFCSSQNATILSLSLYSLVTLSFIFILFPIPSNLSLTLSLCNTLCNNGRFSAPQGGQPLQAHRRKFRFANHSRALPFAFLLPHRSSAQLYSLCLCLFPVVKP